MRRAEAEQKQLIAQATEEAQRTLTEVRGAGRRGGRRRAPRRSARTSARIAREVARKVLERAV